MITTDYIDFPGLIDHAMRDVVRKALDEVAARGLPGDHHFFISFKTDFPGVKISPVLKDRHPEEMTIVLQHQFWDLQVDDHKFSVTLSFNNVPEKLEVPFQALTAFADPSVKFGLQFHSFIDDELMEELLAAEEEADLLESLSSTKKAEVEGSKGKKGKAKEKPVDPENVVVTLDAFRNKKKSTKKDDKKK